ncbi:MAG TPA: hypothetical protein VFV01_18135 [Spirillospora sp.]|nr:hypothetical protein [Spirillospora sp.]
MNGDAPPAAGFDPLTTDPDALLRKVGGGPDLAFHTLRTILWESLHPPKTEAAIYQAIKRIPVDADGRPAISLGLTGRDG